MRARTAEQRQSFSVYLPNSLYQKLVDRAGKGKLNTFIIEVLGKELSNEEERLINEYRECYSNPRMLKEAKQWEQAEIESWRDFEKNKKEKDK